MATSGKNIDNADITVAVPVSIAATAGLATPPVVAVEVSRVADVAPFIAVAVPPPAIIANDHVITGSRLATVDTITAVPAMAVRGIVMLSNKLSPHGIK